MFIAVRTKQRRGSHVKLVNAHLLRGLIAETGLTYRELEQPFGLHNSHLANIIAGRRSISQESAERVCRYLAVDLTRLFADDIAHDIPSIA
jgi:cyanate lyase